MNKGWFVAVTYNKQVMVPSQKGHPAESICPSVKNHMTCEGVQTPIPKTFDRLSGKHFQ